MVECLLFCVFLCFGGVFDFFFQSGDGLVALRLSSFSDKSSEILAAAAYEVDAQY